MQAVQGVVSTLQGAYIDVRDRKGADQQRGNAKYISCFLNLGSKVKQQPFRIRPTDTGVGDGFAEHVVVLLVAFF